MAPEIVTVIAADEEFPTSKVASPCRVAPPAKLRPAVPEVMLLPGWTCMFHAIAVAVVMGCAPVVGLLSVWVTAAPGVSRLTMMLKTPDPVGRMGEKKFVLLSLVSISVAPGLMSMRTL